jgi:hypothetical protein
MADHLKDIERELRDLADFLVVQKAVIKASAKKESIIFFDNIDNPGREGLVFRPGKEILNDLEIYLFESTPRISSDIHDSEKADPEFGTRNRFSPMTYERAAEYILGNRYHAKAFKQEYFPRVLSVCTKELKEPGLIRKALGALSIC